MIVTDAVGVGVSVKLVDTLPLAELETSFDNERDDDRLVDNVVVIERLELAESDTVLLRECELDEDS